MILYFINMNFLTCFILWEPKKMTSQHSYVYCARFACRDHCMHHLLAFDVSAFSGKLPNVRDVTRCSFPQKISSWDILLNIESLVHRRWLRRTVKNPSPCLDLETNPCQQLLITLQSAAPLDHDPCHNIFCCLIGWFVVSHAQSTVKFVSVQKKQQPASHQRSHLTSNEACL